MFDSTAMVPHKPRKLGGSLEHREPHLVIFCGTPKNTFSALSLFLRDPAKGRIVENKKDRKFQQVGFWLKQRSPSLTTTSQVFFKKKTHWTDILLAGVYPLATPNHPGNCWDLHVLEVSTSVNGDRRAFVKIG